MPAYPDIEIGEADLLEYIENESDFAFEIRVVKELMQYGDLSHGGTYIDPNTQKPRQFDIRMSILDESRVIRLAVECKNLKRSYPAIISCLPRSLQEATNDVVISIDVSRWRFDLPDRFDFPGIERLESARVLHPEDTISLYPVGHPVGKAITQVGRDTTGKLNSRDGDVYDKWSQALSSANDLVGICQKDGDRSIRGFCFSCVVPVLVVPDGTLWSCEFDAGGNRRTVPTKVERAQLYVGREYLIDTNGIGPGEPYTLSHLEVVTLSGFGKLIEQLKTYQFLIPKVHEEGILNDLKRPPRD
jgi:hypothetical protein